ncbi:hypothetical protein [uncultured Dialister sp.]|uniref:hypothetical protein n=1 Tax=uncultured Dialister sp. TaxID=278064 RepID=UPI0025EBEFDC|nr:hypothetical protein [uncultured Dialister sp.]
MTTDRKDNENRFSRLWKDKDLTNAFFLGMLAGILLLALALGFWMESGLAKAMRFEKMIPASRREHFLVKSPRKYLYFRRSDGSRPCVPWRL